MKTMRLIPRAFLGLLFLSAASLPVDVHGQDQSDAPVTVPPEHKPLTEPDQLGAEVGAHQPASERAGTVSSEKVKCRQVYATGSRVRKTSICESVSDTQKARTMIKSHQDRGSSAADNAGVNGGG